MQQHLKRIIDLTGAVLGLVVFSPLLLAIAVAVRITMKSPVVFRQLRPGLRGEPFALLKFRTMTNARDENGQLLDDQSRLTRVGRFLRSTSLDELPSLWNVVKGEMSLVGPRPLLMSYLARYTPEQVRRHNVLPGVTGWAQVNGRRNTLFSQRLRLDVWYVDHWSLWLDIRILAKTVARVFSRRGVGNDQQIDEVDDVGLNEGVVFRGLDKSAKELPRKAA